MRSMMRGTGQEIAPARALVVFFAMLSAYVEVAEAARTESTEAKESHWSFQAPIRPVVPVVDGETTSLSAIDAFVRARLRVEGLTPSPRADAHTLIRRVYLDLLGLPPTPEEVLAFVREDSEEAYGGMVDRLLASPHYGERQARFWLDAARYADTNGYEKDRPRSVWPYRDWVIDAFNRDLPYDRFVIEQIAGDMLPGATDQQRIATGFHRNTMLNEEGGIDAGEDRYKRLVDRMATTGTVFLGLTMTCAQCHDHKFDPVSQREYFRMMAFYENAVETEQAIQDARVQRQRDKLRQKMTRLEEFAEWHAGWSPTFDEAFRVWQTEARTQAHDWTVLRPTRMNSKNSATLVRLDDDSILATGDIPNDDEYDIEMYTTLTSFRALRLEVLPHESLPGGGPGRGTILAEGDFLLNGIEVFVAPWDAPESFESIGLTDATSDYAAKGRSAKQAFDGSGDTGWGVKGRLAQPHRAVFQFEGDAGWEGGTLVRVRLRQDYIHQHVIGRFRIAISADEGTIDAASFPHEVEQALLARPDESTEVMLRAYYLKHVSPELERERRQLAQLKQRLPKYPTTLSFDEGEVPRQTLIRKRGEYLSPEEPVEPGVPSVLHQLPEGATPNRLTLARWLVSEDNPLAGRVAMNRMWQQLFGVGLVSTSEDFGLRGAAPTHPELFDWLATEFVARGWSWKSMMREVLLSETYRQSSYVSEDLLRRDPNNRWLARAPRLRVEAETVRDSALAVSGLLNRKIGGPSVYPPQPKGVTSLAYGGPSWPTSKNRADRYRRGLYTYWKRTAPFAMATTFDAPTSEEACVRRARSNTPLQALTLLNDRVFMDVAQHLARRVLKDDSISDAERVRRLYLLCLSRYPDDFEEERVLEFIKEQRRRFATSPESVSEISGLDARNPFMPDATSETAAWTLVCRAMLNLDEMVTKP